MTESDSSSPRTETRLLSGETAMSDFGRSLADTLRGGDIVLLDGEVGAGKSTLARALIRTLGRNDALEVPSPTFTLVQEYPLSAGLRLLHYDLYRLDCADELIELGWEDAGSPDMLTLVEWPDRLGRLPNGPVLHIQIASAQNGAARRLLLHWHGDWSNR